MSVRVEVKRVSKRNEVMKQYETMVRRIVAKGGQDTMNTAKQSIQAHGSSGRTYSLSNPKRIHTASAPLNPPNSDTGYLVSNIHLVFPAEDTGFAAEVESRAEYSAHLEFGTSKMRERPFLQPALEENRPKIRSMFARLKARG
jgi:HK97 gp10 family phage protein